MQNGKQGKNSMSERNGVGGGSELIVPKTMTGNKGNYRWWQENYYIFIKNKKKMFCSSSSLFLQKGRRRTTFNKLCNVCHYLWIRPIIINYECMVKSDQDNGEQSKLTMLTTKTKLANHWQWLCSQLSKNFVKPNKNFCGFRHSNRKNNKVSRTKYSTNHNGKISNPPFIFVWFSWENPNVSWQEEKQNIFSTDVAYSFHSITNDSWQRSWQPGGKF